MARFEQSRALLTGARANFYPQLTLGGTPNGDITRQQTSVNQPNQGSANGTAHTYDTFTAPIYLGWEIDLWGSRATAIRSRQRTFCRQRG